MPSTILSSFDAIPMEAISILILFKFILLFSPTEIALSEISFKLVEKIPIIEWFVSIASPAIFSYELFYPMNL